MRVETDISFHPCFICVLIFALAYSILLILFSGDELAIFVVHPLAGVIPRPPYMVSLEVASSTKRRSTAETSARLAVP